MSANTFRHFQRARELRFDAWFDSSPSLPSWLSTASGSTPGALPANTSLTASGMQAGGGFYTLTASGSDAVGAAPRICVTNTLTGGAKEIEFGVEGWKFSETSSTEGAFATQMDYMIALAGGGMGFVLEHSSAAGETQIRIIESGVTRVVSADGLQLVKMSQGDRQKSVGLRMLTLRGNNTHAVQMLVNGEDALTIPVNFGNQLTNNSIRASFGMVRVSGSAAQTMQFDSVILRVKR